MEGELLVDGRRTWFRVVGELDPEALQAPVVVLHGGPGATHDYVAPIAGLSRPGRACVLYDQVGNGRSEHLPDADPSLWTVDLFATELEALLEHLGIDGRYHLVGHSWGGMLGFAHALGRPPGLLSLVAADAPASMRDFAAGCAELRATLPEAVRRVLDAEEAAGRTSSPAYLAAAEEFAARFVCRLDPWPDAVVRTNDAIADDPTVYATMNGPAEFRVEGTLRDWDVTDRLGEVEVPVLLVSGGHDEVRPWVVERAAARLRDAEWVLLEDASHMPHLEAPERFLGAVGAFLARVERGGPGGGEGVRSRA
jgi:L-proline amide hydrolase